jgi:hypothetical protein
LALPPPRQIPVRVSRQLEPFEAPSDRWLYVNLDR